MNSHLVIIENPPSPVHKYLSRDLIPELSSHVELATWDSLTFQKLQQRPTQVLVAVAMPPSPEAIDLFKWLREHPITSPTLAVLANDVDDEIFRIVSQSTDDFVLWPTHTGELRHRLQRMVCIDHKRDELVAA